MRTFISVLIISLLVSIFIFSWATDQIERIEKINVQTVENSYLTGCMASCGNKAFCRVQVQEYMLAIKNLYGVQK